MKHRWSGLEIDLIDVQVQGELAPGQIVDAIEQFNRSAQQPDVLIVIRGGGSADDLQAFSTEQVTRAVAASRIPTMVAIGHEVDISLAELAADVRASTPSNAAELLVPDRREVTKQLSIQKTQITDYIEALFSGVITSLEDTDDKIETFVEDRLLDERNHLDQKFLLINAYNPEALLRRGYTIVRNSTGKIIRTGKNIMPDDIINLRFIDADASAQIKKVKFRDGN